MKKCKLLVIVGCIAAMLATFAIVSIAQNSGGYDPNKFVPSPKFAPIYPPLPHAFRDLYGIQLLCQAPPGAIKKALMSPLEPVGNGDLFILLMGHTADVNDGGFYAHEVAINAPVTYKGRQGTTTLVEYIDTDMGLVAGREVYGWPKKMADIYYRENQGTNTWTFMVNKQKDQAGIPLIKVEYKVTNTPSNVQWPEGGPTLLVRRIPPASMTMKVLNQLVCVGCGRLEDAGIPIPGSGPTPKPASKKPQGPGQGPQRTETTGTATLQFFDGPWDPLTMFGPVKVLDAKMSFTPGRMQGGLGVGDVLDQWESEE
ncbi:MAG: acetoacetate decarboxylase family protein [Acidobacteria bacterium]|nr:acetoacetate decarboxylase family protein [Acidobacteriota bacterium]